MAPLSPAQPLLDLADRLEHRARRLHEVADRLSQDVKELREGVPGRRPDPTSDGSPVKGRPLPEKPWDGRLAAEYDAHATNRLRQLRHAVGELKGAAAIIRGVGDEQHEERVQLRELAEEAEGLLKQLQVRHIYLPYKAPDSPYDPRWRQVSSDVKDMAARYL